MYGKVLGVNLPWMQQLGQLRGQRRIPFLLTLEELGRVFAMIHGEHALLAQLLYCTGHRVAEALQLSITDLDVLPRALNFRQGKGGQDWGSCFRRPCSFRSRCSCRALTAL